jgi:hypothetical protein
VSSIHRVRAKHGNEDVLEDARMHDCVQDGIVWLLSAPVVEHRETPLVLDQVVSTDFSVSCYLNWLMFQHDSMPCHVSNDIMCTGTFMAKPKSAAQNAGKPADGTALFWKRSCFEVHGSIQCASVGRCLYACIHDWIQDCIA